MFDVLFVLGLFAVSLVVALPLGYRPAGDYRYRVLTSAKHWRAERFVYRAAGVNPDGELPWGVYARSVLAFSGVSVLFLYLFQRIQHHLWLSLGDHQGVRHQRGRLLQRQQRPPVREPDHLDQLAADLPAADDQLQPSANVRPDRGQQPPGL
ncbi:MAG: potassium-transporting ATPase potassium-binding subunit, partial [Cryptosporangiaceae bacterium]|nr:potassium-transporting ATPase potassium-binding subunit [Cryptosporangiaceae bacterium]